MLLLGVDPNTCTRLGLSLLHIAALRDEVSYLWGHAAHKVQNFTHLSSENMVF